MHCGEDSVRVAASPCGLGVFSLRSLKAHERIGPIDGTIMADPDYESDYCMELGKDLALEPEGPFRYLNHSCHPNCTLVEIEVEYANGTVVPELWVEMEADVRPGEQLTIDYAWPARVAIPCNCGAPDCRGWIVSAEDLDRVLRSKAASAMP